MQCQSPWETVHWLYLTAVHDLTEKADTNGVEPARIMEALSLEEYGADDILGFLVRAGVVVWPAKGEILITELGITMVEKMGQTARKKPRESDSAIAETVRES